MDDALLMSYVSCVPLGRWETLAGCLGTVGSGREWELVRGRSAPVQVPATQRPCLLAFVPEGWEAHRLPPADISAAVVGFSCPKGWETYEEHW